MYIDMVYGDDVDGHRHEIAKPTGGSEMKNGFLIRWESRKTKKDGSKTTGEYFSESKTDIDRKAQELKRKGYKVQYLGQAIR